MLDLDLVGQPHDVALAREVLPTAPSRWYLSGFQASHSAPAPSKVDLQQDDEFEAADLWLAVRDWLRRRMPAYG